MSSDPRSRLVNMAGRLVARLVRSVTTDTRPQRPTEPTQPRPAPAGSAYPGDAVGPVNIDYAPVDDALADPGEIVWAWIPYEEDHTRGKDRPALIIGRDGRWLLALQVTSQDHDRDAAAEAGAGRYWVDLGSGAWDQRGRASEARVNRLIRLDPGAVRRIGARLSRDRFEAVAREVRRHW